MALAMIQAVRHPLERILQHDTSLAKQLRAAATSVALNLGEGRRRIGKDRLHFWRIAAGSADESCMCLRIATSWGFVAADDVAEALGLLDRILAICWTLTHR